MAAPFIVPFNFQPASAPSLKTTSYTIPAGKYAQIEDTYGDSTVNGNNTSYDVILHNQSQPTGIGVSYYYQIPRFAKYITFNYSVLTSNASNTIQSSTGDYGYSGTTWTANATGTTRTIWSGAGTTSTGFSKEPNYGADYLRIFMFNNTAVTNTVSCITRFWVSPNSTYWVPSGTVLNGSSYLVTEFNMIS